MPRGVVFKSFLDKKWWNNIVVAKTSLVCVSVAVLENFVYSIVDTVRLNSPLSYYLRLEKS